MSEATFPKYYREYFKPKRYKGLYGGRGSGKSHAFAGHLVLRMASERGFRAVCVREVQRSIADSVKQLIEDKITAFGLTNFFKITDAEITGVNGSKCIFRGMQNHTAASIKSLEGMDLAWVEEAQTITQKSWELLTPTIRKPGSEIWASWNPLEPDDPVDVFFRAQADDPEFLVRMVNHDDNKWFPDELRKDMERDRTREPDKYAHVWGGQYRSMSEARVFRNWRVGQMDVPSNVMWFYGVDWGFSVDPTAAVRVCFPQDLSGGIAYVDCAVSEVGVPIDKTPEFLSRVPGISKWPSRADSARPETIDYMRRNGFPKMRKAKKGKGSIEHGVTFLQSFDIVVHPDAAPLIDELRSYAFKTDPRTGEILPALEDENNHCIDALRMACEGLAQTRQDA